MKKTRFRLPAVLFAFAVVAAACGDDGGGAVDTTPTATEPAGEASTEPATEPSNESTEAPAGEEAPAEDTRSQLS